MSYPAHVWSQLKGLTADDMVRALRRDGWTPDTKSGAVLVFVKPPAGRITVHYHPRKTFGPSLLKQLIEVIGWSEADLRRLKLVR